MRATIGRMTKGTPMPLNSEDLARLFDLHSGAMLAFLARRTYDPEIAVDILAETFAEAFEDRERFRGRESEARAWLFAIARHRLTDFFRRGRVERRALPVLGVERRSLTDAEYDRIEELAASQDLRDRVASGLEELSSEQRDALRLRVVEERPYAYVARSLGISEQTARARVSRALRALRSSPVIAELMEVTDHV
jgi:RNA polymerase sigma factor (sigma-70 family)